MPTDPSFHMIVQDVFSIRGRGTVVTGSIDSGTLHPGDEVLIRGGGRDKKVVVASIESFNKVIEAARAGNAVGILLKDVNPRDVDRGFELVSPGTGA